MNKYHFSGAGTTTNIYPVHWFLLIMIVFFSCMAVYSCVVDYYRYEESVMVIKDIRSDVRRLVEEKFK